MKEKWNPVKGRGEANDGLTRLMNRQPLEVQIAWACRILFMHGHGDFTLGHVSAREKDEEIYIKRNGLGLGEVSPEDVLVVDLAGKKISGEGDLHLETFLHTEIYKKRSDVKAILHTHPEYCIAFGSTEGKLEFLGHDSVLFKDGIAKFEETAELIIDHELGRSVAEALNACQVVLLRNHGLIVVGKDVPWAVITALALERAIRIQHIASGIGPLRPMAPKMVEKLYPTKYSDELVSLYWDFLIREALRNEAGEGMHLEYDTGTIRC